MRNRICVNPCNLWTTVFLIRKNSSNSWVVSFSPLGSKTGNPWVDKFGWFKDDPTFDDLEAEIASYRKEIDREMGYSAR